MAIRLCLWKHDFETGNYEGDLTTYCFCAAEAFYACRDRHHFGLEKDFYSFESPPAYFLFPDEGTVVSVWNTLTLFLFLSLSFVWTQLWDGAGGDWSSYTSAFKNKKEKRWKQENAGCPTLLVLSDMSKIQFQIKHGFLSMP